MDPLVTDDRKYLLVGALGALLAAGIAGGAYYAYLQWGAQKQGSAPMQNRPLTQDEKTQLVKAQTATGSSTLTQKEEQTLLKTQSATGESTLTSEEKQKLLESMSAH